MKSPPGTWGDSPPFDILKVASCAFFLTVNGLQCDVAFLLLKEGRSFEVFMETNPFAAPTSYLAEQQQIRRERVKITFYGVVGTMIVFCLALLFQGCQHHEAAAENPIRNQEAAMAVPANIPAPVVPATPVVETNSQPGSGPAFAGHLQTSAAPAVSAAPIATPVTETLYVIKPGDSLIKIAKATRTTVTAIKAANGLTSERLAVGKTLKIPSVNS